MLETLIKSKLEERVLDTFPLVTNTTFSNVDLEEEFDFKGEKRKVQQKHIIQWANKFKSILDKYIPKDSICYVAGGSVLTYILYGNELMIRDFDIFASSESEFKKIDQYLMELKPKNIVENNNTKHFTFKTIEIDLIKKPFKYIDELLESFDIDLCKVGFDIVNDKWAFRKKITFTGIFSLQFSIPNLEKINFGKDGIKTLKRVIKYTTKGFTPKRGTLTQLYSHILLHQKHAASLEAHELSDFHRGTIAAANATEINMTSEKLIERLNDDYQFIDGDDGDEGDVFTAIPTAKVTSSSASSSFSSSSTPKKSTYVSMS